MGIMSKPLDALSRHIDIYLQWIDRVGNKRDDERAALQKLLNSGRICGLPAGIQIIHRGDGAPHFPPEIEMGISISHSDHVLAVAIYPKSLRVGIDIEERFEQAASLIRRVADSSELELMEQFGLPPVVLWGAKEAVFKAYSDQVSTMSDQVKLISCHTDRSALTLQTIPDGACSPLESTVFYSFSAHLGEAVHPIFSFPFVLSIAANNPRVDYSVLY